MTNQLKKCNNPNLSRDSRCDGGLSQKSNSYFFCLGLNGCFLEVKYYLLYSFEPTRCFIISSFVQNDKLSSSPSYILLFYVPYSLLFFNSYVFFYFIFFYSWYALFIVYSSLYSFFFSIVYSLHSKFFFFFERKISSFDTKILSML